MFRGDPSHRGVYPVSGVPRLGGLAWRTGTEGTVRSSPAVTRDRVFVGSSDGHLYALDRATGAVRWKYAAGGSVLSSPAVANGLVLFTRRDGTLVALDAERGSVRWQVRTGAELRFPWGREGWDFYVSSPVIAGSVAIFAGGDGNIYALDAATGRALALRRGHPVPLVTRGGRGPRRGRRGRRLRLRARTRREAPLAG
jgi:outer membrane protein assembly factor BamB